MDPVNALFVLLASMLIILAMGTGVYLWKRTHPGRS